MYSLVLFSENKLPRMGKYIQPKRVFGKLSSSLTFCLTLEDLLFVDISPFTVGSEGAGIED